jgi:hypothetical protein
MASCAPTAIRAATTCSSHSRAANLVDRVLPAVPVRQWVLSLPWELRALAAFRADVLSALARMFVEAIFARHRRWAKKQGFGEAPSGAVTHVQRFGSSVNLNVHFHVMVLDGVFTRDELLGWIELFFDASGLFPDKLADRVRRGDSPNWVRVSVESGTLRGHRV